MDYENHSQILKFTLIYLKCEKSLWTNVFFPFIPKNCLRHSRLNVLDVNVKWFSLYVKIFFHGPSVQLIKTILVYMLESKSPQQPRSHLLMCTKSQLQSLMMYGENITWIDIFIHIRIKTCFIYAFFISSSSCIL